MASNEFLTHTTTPRALAAALSFVLLACSTPVDAPPVGALPQMPEAATHAQGTQARTSVHARKQMVAAAHPLAADAGVQMLRAGGSALDAAIAAQMVLALVEPQSSGLGGGAFLMHWDGHAVQAFDGRETAPAAADEKLFLAPDGKPLPFMQAVVGGRSVGVPGAVRMLEMVHRQHGRLPWARLFEPAIALAEQGFEMGPRLHALLASDKALRGDAQAREYFYASGGQPQAVGYKLRNPALAHILRAVAAKGSVALHEGPIAADIVARVRSHAGNPGQMTAADLAGYAPKQRAAICTVWQAAYRICGHPPPSSGHLAVMQMLGIMEQRAAIAAPLLAGSPGPDWLHVYTEAARLAYADRAQYLADPDFVQPPASRWTSLLDTYYLRERAARISERSMKLAQPGSPRGEPISWAPQAAQPEYGTSHISVVDAQGQAVALTTSIEAVFGARLMSDGGTGLPGGFLLNNQLTDFSFKPTGDDGRPVANRVQGGKRPRSSMSPTLVFDARSGELLMTLGSPLGAAIPHLVAKTLVATLAWGMDVQQAVDLPNFASFNGPTVLETGRFPESTITALRQRGHEVVQSDLASGLHAIIRTPNGWAGAADSRREGAVRGD